MGDSQKRRPSRKIVGGSNMPPPPNAIGSANFIPSNQPPVIQQTMTSVHQMEQRARVSSTMMNQEVMWSSYAGNYYGPPPHIMHHPNPYAYGPIYQYPPAAGIHVPIYMQQHQQQYFQSICTGTSASFLSAQHRSHHNIQIGVHSVSGDNNPVATVVTNASNANEAKTPEPSKNGKSNGEQNGNGGVGVGADDVGAENSAASAQNSFSTTSGSNSSNNSNDSLSPESLSNLVNAVTGENPSDGAGGDASNKVNASMDGIPYAQFIELTKMALRGCEIAEKVAYAHRNRPCFKKIDSLCARMKQDLVRIESVLPNINSQGVAWAVKDFIFVFTRIVNAWIIVKGYVYNIPDGMEKITSALSDDFNQSFLVWQSSTKDFISSLIKSFVSFNNLVQSQKNWSKSDNESANTTATNGTTATGTPPPTTDNSETDEMLDLFNTSPDKCNQNGVDNNYLYTMIEDSEDTQRKAKVDGTYFKTGTYNPIKKDELVDDQLNDSSAASASNVLHNPNTKDFDSVKQVTDDTIDFDIQQSLSSLLEDKLCEFWMPDDAEHSVEFLNIKEKLPPHWLDYKVRVNENVLKQLDPTQPEETYVNKDLVDKLNSLINVIMSMKHAEYFFKWQFTKNYFPEFIAKYQNEIIDVQSILLKCQACGYKHIFEAVHDMRRIVHFGKQYLQFKPDYEFQVQLFSFDKEFTHLLKNGELENFQFDHIEGKPHELLYKNVRIL